MKKLLTLFTFLGLSALPLLAEDKVPAVFDGFLVPDVAVKGEVVVVVPPEEIQEFIDTVEASAKENPEWFAEYSRDAKPGIPLPFHEKLGLSKEEYAEYLKLWDARQMEPAPQGELIVRLEKTSKGDWMIRVTGQGSDITTMRYDEAKDTFTSMSGTLARIEDIKADKRSILGEWVGKEWKMEQNDGFGITKENLAIGKLADGSYGLLVYRLQEVSTSGRRLFEKSMVIRFAVKRP